MPGFALIMIHGIGYPIFPDNRLVPPCVAMKEQTLFFGWGVFFMTFNILNKF